LDLPTFSTNEEIFFGDYIGVDAVDGVVVATFPHFISSEKIAMSAAIYKFIPGTNTRIDPSR